MAERVDGQHLIVLNERGSDALLSAEACDRIAEAIQYANREDGHEGTHDGYRRPRSR
jgi:hypothetical protein